MKIKLLITLLAFAPVLAIAQTSTPPVSSSPGVSVGSISNPNAVNTNMNISNPNTVNTNISNPNNVNTYISNPNNVNTNYSSNNTQGSGNNSGNTTGNGSNSGNVSVGNPAVVIVAPSN
jgi:hypothetical protein